MVLTEGWADSEEFRDLLKELEKNRQGLSYTAFFHIISRTFPPDKLFDEVLKFIPKAEKDYYLRSDVNIRPLVRRAKNDDAFFRLMVEKLHNDATPSQKINFVKLISFARGTSEIRQWCIEEIERQIIDVDQPEVGLD